MIREKVSPSFVRTIRFSINGNVCAATKDTSIASTRTNGRRDISQWILFYFIPFCIFFSINKYFQVLFKRVAILGGSDGGESRSSRGKRRNTFGVASFVTVTKSKIKTRVLFHAKVWNKKRNNGLVRIPYNWSSNDSTNHHRDSVVSKYGISIF